MNLEVDKFDSYLPARIGAFFVVGLAALLSVTQLLSATHWGIGFAPDSINYLNDARSIINHKDLSHLSSHWPPLYQLLISASGLFSEDVIAAIKWIHLTLYLGNFCVFVLIIYYHSSGSSIAAVLGALVFASSTYLLRIHAVAWSEPLFCLLALCSVHFLARHATSPNFKVLLAAALCTGLACITRYAGISLFLTGAVSLLVLSNQAFLSRLKAMMWFSLIACIPLAAWMGRNLGMNMGATNRQLSFHLIESEKLEGGIDVLLGLLFIPEGYGFLLPILFFAMVALTIFTGTDNDNRFSGKNMIWICYLFISIYLLFLLASISFVDAHTPLDYRILIPVYLFFILAVIMVAISALCSAKFQLTGLLIIALLMLLSWQQFQRQTAFIAKAQKNGIGFADQRWVQSDLISQLNRLDRQLIVYSNAPEPVAIYSLHTARMLPKHTEPGTQRKNPYFQKQMDSMGEEIQSGRAVIAYFNLVTWRWYLPTSEDLIQAHSYRKIFSNEDGQILGSLANPN